MRKYRRGATIFSFDEMLEQDFVYWHGKIVAKGWFVNWQVRMTHNALQHGEIYKAIKIKEGK
jgi:hypothetical protein